LALSQVRSDASLTMSSTFRTSSIESVLRHFDFSDYCLSGRQLADKAARADKIAQIRFLDCAVVIQRCGPWLRCRRPAIIDYLDACGAKGKHFDR